MQLFFIVLACGVSLAGCASFSGSFDPSRLTEIFSLEAEREPEGKAVVFPRPAGEKDFSSTK